MRQEGPYLRQPMVAALALNDSSMLLLGYGRISDALIRVGVRELAAAVRAVRR
jgi:hypothetical protein